MLSAETTLSLGCGRRGGIRTCNRRIRNPMLYPFEIRALANVSSVYQHRLLQKLYTPQELD